MLAGCTRVSTIQLTMITRMHDMKRALITGITGQDGAYLAEFLLEKGYEVHGSKPAPRSTPIASIISTRIRTSRVRLHCTTRPDRCHQSDPIVQQTQPDEIYNLAAQSHVGVSFETGVHANSTLSAAARARSDTHTGVDVEDALLPGLHLRDVRKVRKCRSARPRRFIRGRLRRAKVYAYWITVNYREAYGLFACNGFSSTTSRRFAARRS